MKTLTVDILKNANLSNQHFATLVGVSVGTLGRYFTGNCTANNFNRIEIGAQILIETEMVWPDIKYIPNAKTVKGYEKNKKKSDRLDKKFATAYNRALKKAKLI